MSQKESRMHRLFGRVFNYANNAFSVTGIVIATVAALSIITFLLVDLATGFHNPYVGIIAFVILPSIFLFGLLLIPIGMWWRRRKLLAGGASAGERRRFPRLDFNDPRIRRIATIILALTSVNVIIFGFSSFMAVEHMETVEFCGTTCHTVMQPEFTAYQQSPHSRVSCVECHIGPGASWFVKSKVDGLHQVWAVAIDNYPQPITTPLETLRPARETCEQCHWPDKHYGDKVRIFARYDTDETNSASYTAMLLKTGGGSLDLGRHGGVHWWHIYSDNRIRYVSDESREEISWVELTTPDGEIRTYTRDGEGPPPEAIADSRTMDCIDCHNRPTHLMKNPSKALDEIMETQPELVALPFFKKEAMEAIGDDGYPTHAEGVAAVRDKMIRFYEERHPDLWRERKQVVEHGADMVARVYSRSFFPEMNTGWQTHANHIGHEDSPGCFRCHDEMMSTADGEHVITMDCETCHVFLVDGVEDPPDIAALVNGG